MSIPQKLKNIPLALRQTASEELRVEITTKKQARFTSKKEFLDVYHVREGVGYFPYNYARNKLNLPIKLRSDYPQVEIKYKSKEFPLREEQVEVKNKAIAALNKEGSCILALYTGFGKTCLSIHIASRLKMKTLYINNRLAIIGQIAESVEKFSHSKAQLLSAQSELDPDVDFYVINAINLPKFKPGTFDCIGTLIVDEVHCMLSEVLSRALHHVTPRYLIGLSATPYRDDGLNSLFDLYFGPERIYIPLNRRHLVYKIETPFVPPTEFTEGGILNWGAILKFQSSHEVRNQIILNILAKFKDRVFMVICKRVEQVKYLEQKLLEMGESVSALYGNKKKYDAGARILIGTGQKMGVGFDHPRVNALVLAADFEAYFIQVLGRSMRKPEVEPIIFDVVDKYKLLEKHWNTREKIYRDHGGCVKGLDCKSLEEYDLPIKRGRKKKDGASAILFE